MSVVYEIIKLPDPVLKSRANEIANVDEIIRRQMDRMIETMYAAPGVGLAANQVGLLNRILVMDTNYRKEEGVKKPVFMANPQIVWSSEETSVWEEGCLSIPGQYADVKRPAQVRVTYLDYNGHPAEMLTEDPLMAHCVQHEIDHLNGVLFIDHLSSLKRNMLLKRYSKEQKAHDAL